MSPNKLNFRLTTPKHGSLTASTDDPALQSRLHQATLRLLHRAFADMQLPKLKKEERVPEVIADSTLAQIDALESALEHCRNLMIDIVVDDDELAAEMTQAIDQAADALGYGEDERAAAGLVRQPRREPGAASGPGLRPARCGPERGHDRADLHRTGARCGGAGHITRLGRRMSAPQLNRAQRRAQQRQPAQRAGRKVRYPTARNPMGWAVMRKQAAESFAKLKTDAGLHAYMGGDWAVAAHHIGRWLYIVHQAALDCGNDPAARPELRVIAGAASALGDIVECPGTLDANRQALISGMTAAAQVEPELPQAALIGAALQLQTMLASPQGLRLHDFTQGA